MCPPGDIVVISLSGKPDFRTKKGPVSSSSKRQGPIISITTLRYHSSCRRTAAAHCDIIITHRCNGRFPSVLLRRHTSCSDQPLRGQYAESSPAGSHQPPALWGREQIRFFLIVAFPDRCSIYKSYYNRVDGFVNREISQRAQRAQCRHGRIPAHAAQAPDLIAFLD